MRTRTKPHVPTAAARRLGLSPCFRLTLVTFLLSHGPALAQDAPAFRASLTVSRDGYTTFEQQVELVDDVSPTHSETTSAAA